ncbi:odorant receptor 4-like [Belonocnema kinseyi]|uniref:odorant receptor 4-like n=1 Tax=Belonocnema kinseyi TaxID=2817044 RepID=UPI00143D6190|nr:odorant receptor 4-like [Belonocnema kinseyi]
MVAILIKHRKILEIIDMLHSKVYEPQDCEEDRIQENYDKIGRFGTMTFITSVSIAILVKVIGLLTKDEGIRSFKMWVPYSLENGTSYWLTYVLYFVGFMIIAQISVAGDTFAIVMMLQLCAQLEILKHRILKYPQLCMKEFPKNPRTEQRNLGKWIEHHNSLYIFAIKLNDVYSAVFFILLLSATLDVCTCTYFLATLRITSMKFWSMSVSLICIMFEIYLYCFQGSFLMEKSMDIRYAAYSMDWFLLSKTSRRDIIQIMRRSSKPITITGGSIFPLSIDTFNSEIFGGIKFYSDNSAFFKTHGSRLAFGVTIVIERVLYSTTFPTVPLTRDANIHNYVFCLRMQL